MASVVSPVVVVIGANGLVGEQVCRALVERGAQVRGVVRRAGTAPEGVTEVVGAFTDPGFAAHAVAGADAVVTTVHPMGSDRAAQEQVGVRGTATLARAAAAAGVGRLVHVSTAAVYDRSPQAGDVTESSTLVGDDADDYAVTKRDTEAALAAVDGVTRVLLRPPAIIGAGSTSVWNTLRPRAFREDESNRHAVPDASWPWVHVRDLAAFAADLATGAVADRNDPEHGPVAGKCTPVSVVAGTDRQRDYYETIARALGLEPIWDDHPAWHGQLRNDRARAWGWTPTVDLAAAQAELRSGLRG